MSMNVGSIYGPGVLNDTIVPGYGVTKFPVNLPTFWSLPNGTTRNFGQATQYVTYPEGYPNAMYQLGYNFTDPSHISQWNPMLIGTGINFNTNSANPALTQAGLANAYQFGANMVQQMQIQQTIQGIAGVLNSMESSLTNVLKSDKLTNAQKAKLEGLLEDVKALKSKIENQLKAKNPTKEEVTEMQKEVLDLQKKVSETAGKISAEVNEGGNAASSTSSSASSSTSSSASGSASSDPTDLTGTEYENIDPETGRPAELGDVPSYLDAEEFCANLERCIHGAGTDVDTLRNTILPGLTAGNIVEVIKHWEETRGTHESNEGLFARLFKDLNDGEQKEMVPKLLKALTDRAQALGIADDIKQEIADINKELLKEGHKWYCLWLDSGQDDDVLKNNLMSIYDKIVAKEAANKTGAQEVIDGKKSENETKVNNRKNEVITEKKNEIALKIKEALELKDTPALSSALKIETDDNGEFTGYSIELNTQNGKVKVTGCTYQQLALAIESNGLKVEDVLIRKTQA